MRGAILAGVQQLSRLSVTVTFLKNLRKYLCSRSKKIPLGPAQSIFKPRWPFPYHPRSLTPPLWQCQQSGRNKSHRKGSGGAVCFAYFQPWGPESFNSIPCCDPGKWAGLFNDYLRVICLLLLLASWCCDCLDGSGCRRPRPHWSCWHLALPSLLFPFMKGSHVDNNQPRGAAPWLSRRIGPELCIVPLRGNKTCVSSMTFIIAVVWWLVPQLCVRWAQICRGIKLQCESQTRFPLTSSCSS